MFIKIHCPICDSDMYHDIRLSALEYLHFEGEREACRYVIENIEIQDSLTEEELVRSILKSLQKVIYDGIEVENLIEVLEETTELQKAAAWGLLRRIQRAWHVLSR